MEFCMDHWTASHDTSCLDPKCTKTKPYDDYIERAADDQIEQWKVLNE